MFSQKHIRRIGNSHGRNSSPRKILSRSLECAVNRAEMNVHTTTFPTEEIRGELCHRDDE